MSRIRFLSLLLPALGCGVVVSAAPVQTAHVEAELVAETTSIQPGQPFTVGLRLEMDEHWHVYWINPGDSGLAPAINWSLPTGFTVGEIQWPTPHRIPTPPFMTYGYEGEILLMVEVSPPADLEPGTQVELNAHADWLVCEAVCMPGEAALTMQLPVEAGTPSINEAWSALFAKAREDIPADRSEAWPATFSVRGQDYVLEVDLPAEATVAAPDVYFFPLDELVIEPSAPQRTEFEDGRLTVRMARSKVNPESPGVFRGVLTAPDGFGLELADRSVYLEATPASSTTRAATASSSFLVTAGLGFLGGLILNLMPCVFPVLGIKILGFVHQAGADRRKVTLHGLVFTGGVLVSFWSLAGVLAILRAGGEQLGWGFQLQSPVFVFGLAVFLLIFALNLTGWFEIGLAATAVGGSLQSQSGLTGSFFSGVLATVVATPCAAPFLAPALGAAITQPPAQSFTLFTIIALGLATPYLVLSVFPQLVKILPRPGAWMETFKQLMAFPLYATVGFLVWVLAGQVSESAFLNALIALVLVAMAAWAYGRWGQAAGSRRRKATGFVLAGLLLTSGVALGVPQPTDASDIVWQEWSPERVAELRDDGQIVFIDFTARWCVTCKANKAVVFSSGEVRDTFAELGIVALKADWTNRDPRITQALASYDRQAVPVNVIYAPGNAEPIMLPELLTPGIVLDVLARVSPRAARQSE